MRLPWWLSGTHLPVQETLVPYLVREDPTCYATTKLMHIRKEKKKWLKWEISCYLDFTAIF